MEITLREAVNKNHNVGNKKGNLHLVYKLYRCEVLCGKVKKGVEMHFSPTIRFGSKRKA